MKRQRMGLLLLAMAVSLSVSPARCSNDSNLSQGICYYNSRSYAAAVEKLEAAVRADSNNARAHYYLALSYQALRRLDDAKREYTWNYQHKKDKTLAYQSWQGLVGLERMRHGSPSSASSAASTPAAAAVANDTAPPDHRPTAGTPVAVKSVPLDMHYQFKAGCPRHGGGM